MAKGQKRSSREAKKSAKTLATPVSPFDARQQGQKKSGTEPAGAKP